MAGQRTPLVGRERELAALAGVLARAREGEGGVAVCTGEPGIGKSSLLEHTADRAAELGFTVTWGRAWEAGGAPPQWIWIDALRPLIDEPAAAAAADRVRSLILDGAEAAADPFHLCDAVGRFVAALATAGPLLIALEDLHAADVASLHIALFVARQLRDQPIALVASYRDVEARLSPPRDELLARIGRLGEVMPLARLDFDSVAALVRDQVGKSDREVARMIMDATEGNPLFVRELLRLIQARSSGGAPGVPAGVRAVLRERLALLSPATVALLQAAAVLGRECAVGLAATVAGVTAEAFEDAASEAAGAALIEAVAPGRIRFSHALVGETLAGDLPAAARARLHRKAAEVLEDQHRDDPAAPRIEIAHHWLRAGAAAGLRAVDAAEVAARVASARLAFADAADLVRQALDALATADPAATRRRVELMLVRCEALSRAGDRSAASAVCREAAGLARTLDDGVLFARLVLALGAELIVGTSDPELERLLEEALERLPADEEAWWARISARLAAARQPEANPELPIAQARQAIAVARKLGDDELLLYVLYAGLAAFTDYAPAAERLPLNRETAALAEALGAAPYELRARSRILFDCVDLLDPIAFDVELAALDALVERMGVPRYRWMPLMFRAMRADWRGEIADADRFVREAAELAAPGEGPFRYGARELMRQLVIESVRDPAAERELLDRSVVAGSQLAPLARAMLEARAGGTESAVEILRELDRSGALRPMVGTEDVHRVQMVAEIAWEAGDAEAATFAYEIAAPMAGRPIALTGMGFLVHETVDHLCQRMAIVRQQWDDMERHARAAESQCNRLGARTLVAHVYADWAIGEAARGDRARAAELAAAAVEIADDIGMPAIAARCRALVDRAPATGPLAMELEGEYWTVRGFGETCRMRDSRGMQMLATLVDRAGEEVHVLELTGAGAVDGGDAGEVLDDQARADYEARLRALRAELDEAESFHDSGRAERARAELDTLAAELSRGFGLGGRKRRAGNATERARSNARRRIADAMSKIADAAPAIGAHLEASVRTGAYCSYTRA